MPLDETISPGGPAMPRTRKRGTATTKPTTAAQTIERARGRRTPVSRPPPTLTTGQRAMTAGTERPRCLSASAIATPIAPPVRVEATARPARDLLLQHIRSAGDRLARFNDD